ncbi:hypothetical protein, partial [Falsiroseomonas oryzae]|uniref:hypothetical protein n=1 Tax=Falsiroseomonas oryzae TaxID=2766473 RepID=UPI0022EB8DB9
IDPPPLRRLPPPEPERSPAALAAVWLLSLALVGAAGWAMWHYRAEITAAWPPAARLYQAIGLE